MENSQQGTVHAPQNEAAVNQTGYWVLALRSNKTWRFLSADGDWVLDQKVAIHYSCASEAHEAGERTMILAGDYTMQMCAVNFTD